MHGNWQHGWVPHHAAWHCSGMAARATPRSRFAVLVCNRGVACKCMPLKLHCSCWQLCCCLQVHAFSSSAPSQAPPRPLPPCLQRRPWRTASRSGASAASHCTSEWSRTAGRGATRLSHGADRLCSFLNCQLLPWAPRVPLTAGLLWGATGRRTTASSAQPRPRSCPLPGQLSELPLSTHFRSRAGRRTTASSSSAGGRARPACCRRRSSARL